MSVERTPKDGCGSVLSGGVGFIWKSARRVGDCCSGSQDCGDHRCFDHFGVGGTRLCVKEFCRSYSTRLVVLT
jgi:hypothetical protein